MDRISEIKARCDAATPAPWIHEEFEYGIHAYDKNIFFAFGMGSQTDCDSEFTAHAREDIPFLLAEIERLTSERDAAVLDLMEFANSISASALKNGTFIKCAKCKHDAECDCTTCFYEWKGVTK